MATPLDELLVGLGFDYDPEELKEFQDDLDKSVNLLKQLVKVAVAAATALTGLAVASTRASDEQALLAEEIGLTVEMVDALQFALQKSGGQAEGMSSSLRNLTKISAEAARGVGGGLEAFGILGINVTDFNGNVRNTNDLLLEVSQRFQALEKARQIELAEKLGLSESIRLLQQGPDAIRQLTQEASQLGVTTEEDAIIARQFQESLSDLWRIVKQGSRILTRELAPILTNIVENISEWWKTNRELIEQKFPKWVEDFIRILKILGVILAISVISRVGTLVFSLVKLTGALKLATIQAALFNAAMGILPFLITAGILLLIGLIEDAIVFFEGGESVIGDLIEKFPEWAKEIKTIATLLKGILDTTVLIFDGWGRIFNLFDKFSLENIKESLSNIPGFLLDLTGIRTLEGGGLLPFLEREINFDAAGQPIEPWYEQYRTNRPNQTTVERVEISVPGAGDPRAVANEVFKVFEQTQQDLISPVDQ